MRLLKYTLLICASLSIMCTAVISPALPMMKRTFVDIHNAEFMVKLAATIPNMFIAIFSPIFGILVAKVKAKRFMLSFAIIYILSGTATYLLADLKAIIISRAILGVALSALMTCALEYISQNFSGYERNKILASQTTVMSIGSIVFTILSGILCDINWRYAFLLYATGIILIPMIIIAIRQGATYYNEKTETVNAEIAVSVFARKFGNKLPALICFIGFLNMIFFYMIPIQIPFTLSKIDPSISGKAISWMITIEVVVSAFFATKYKRLKKNRTFESMCTLSIALMSLSYLCLSYCRSYEAIFCCVAFYGIGMGLIMPNNIVWLVNAVRGKYRGFWIGTLTTGIYLGKFSSPIILKPIIEYFGIFKCYRVVSVAMLFMAIILTFLADGLGKKKSEDRHQVI